MKPKVANIVHLCVSVIASPVFIICWLPQSHIDDEYDPSGLLEPKVCVTTSRDPSSRLKQFAKVPVAVNVPIILLTLGLQFVPMLAFAFCVLKEARLLFPNSQRVNRGSHKTEEVRGASPRSLQLQQCVPAVFLQLVAACRSNGFTDIIVVHETRGEPGLCVSACCSSLCLTRINASLAGSAFRRTHY